MSRCTCDQSSEGEVPGALITRMCKCHLVREIRQDFSEKVQLDAKVERKFTVEKWGGLLQAEAGAGTGF